ncbi:MULTISPECIES: peptidoglycan editing factor PgeF [unclassified Haematospirillum]|uniref:peptidoglycan editing factor PgeF n=1 Tax=unclassified Haematospirillum TaxID=2622088 RepID=UPI00143C83A8|nr:MULTISPECIES: peptidoglycan editing factor PgeF [unclassified Haematospirillum]NKD55337.1 peptidoglycan editing factor PgeF [Haematospirillum sp. H4890]NKD75556.1 peptidoglycan editing factor PgeF [Haematospirillum sp. H4485]NKD88360.1 peptidoglycan editing factor PgeF [Haematospirillum sp. 15-248]
MITVSALNSLSKVRHGFFTRHDGVSEGPFASLNVSLSVGDDPVRVLANRARVAGAFDLSPDRLVLASQNHTAHAVVVEAPFLDGAIPVADALVTASPGMAVAVLTADCAPVLLADGVAGVVAAAHAGWRGAVGGILDSTVRKMVALGAKPGRIAAAIGPCIAQRSYEVGPDFPEHILSRDPDDDRFLAPSRRAGHFLFDLPGYVARQLARLDVGTIMPTPCDTFREEDRFFSHRRATLREEGPVGRQISVIMLEPQE